MNGMVRALAVSGSTVYAGGEFSTAGGSTANRIAQWNGASWSALGTGMNGTVRALAVLGSTVYAGGEFSTAGGSAASYIAQWNGASWSSVGTGTNHRVEALTVNGTDLYAGGFFSSAGGVGANRVARWDGSTWSALGSGLGGPGNAEVYALAFAGGNLYAEGEFSTAGGSAANRIARWNGASWSALGTGVSLINPGGALAGSGTDVYVGGQFVGVGGTAATSLARWDGSGNAWSLATTTPGAGAASSEFYPGVRALARSSSGDVYATGNFEFAGATPARSIAKFDGTAWSALGAGLQGPNFANYGNGFGEAVAFYGGDLYVGGNFATAGGVTVNHIARWNGSSFSALGTGVGSGQVTVNALIEYNGELYVGGSFSTVSGSSIPGLARWNGTSWSAVGSGVNGAVLSFAIIGSDLYVGGTFSTAGGGPAPNVARWNGTSWSAVGSGPGGTALALAAVGSDLYAGGSFGGGTAIRKWDGSTWSTPGGGICYGCGFGGQSVRGLASVGNDLYVTGSFGSVGSGGSAVDAYGIAKWNGVAWSALGSGLPWTCVGSSCPTYSSAGPVLIAGTDVYVGGRFTTAGDKPASFIAAWHNCGDGVVGPNEQCDDGNTTNGDCCSSTCQNEAGGNPCADDGNPCTNDQCNGSGGCAHPPNSLPCNDNVFCNGADTCSGGTCSQHAGNPCPGHDVGPSCDDSCTEAGGGSCTGFDTFGTGCDDGLFCTTTDTCDGGGTCVGTGNPCPGHNVGPGCSDSCTEAGGGSCTGADTDGTGCTDGLFCTGADTCSGGACVINAGDPCVGGPECADTCNEGADNCFEPSGTACTADSNVCTDDECNGAGACAHPNNTDPCDDSLFCNGADTCSGGSCATHAGDPCPGPDGDGNCAESCDEAGDACTLPDPNGGSCADGDPCTSGETCTAGSCGGGTFSPSGCIDHYVCYKAKVTSGTEKFDSVPGVSLVDEFDAVTAEVKKPKAICPPADNNGEGVLDEDMHALSYQVKATPAHLPQQDIEITNQFGTLHVDTVKLDRLLVPTTKGLGSPPVPPVDGVADHYTCYKAKVTPGTPKFPKGFFYGYMADQFQTRMYEVGKPRRLCVPVDKNGEGMVNEAAYLMCYKVKPALGEAHTRVLGQIHTENQFGALRLDTVKEEELCVPAEKNP
jgi:hypothetical protein